MKYLRWAIPILCLNMLVTGWLYVILAMALGFASFDIQLSAVYPWVPIVKWRKWWTKVWKYSTTLAFAIGQHPEHDEHVLAHERVHIRQFRDLGLLSLALAAFVIWYTGNWWAGVWLYIAGPLFMVPNFLGAILEGGNIYRDAEHERSAYAQVD